MSSQSIEPNGSVIIGEDDNTLMHQTKSERELVMDGLIDLVERPSALAEERDRDIAETTLPAPAPLPATAEAVPAKRRSRRGLLLLAAAAILTGGGGFYGYDWWIVGRFLESTDDAYVAASSATVTPKIAGYIEAVVVADNSRVRAGDPLVLLDDADNRIALQQADAQIATQQAAVERIARQILAGQAAIAQAEAQAASARAATDNAEAQFERMRALTTKGFATKKDFDAARAGMLQARSAVDAAVAGVNAAHANLATTEAQKAEAARVLEQDRLARDQARLNLEHTVIRAPFDGVVGNRAAEPGEFVQPGQRLLAVVPLEAVYIDANFKETQLGHLVPGQTAAITVDAYPDRVIEGRVESVSPASGSVFSLLPPDNATGNFTKVTQRVPVRIALPNDVVAEGRIRPGMSVVVEVDTRTGSQQQLAAR
jgi:membrane fusion protein (multidrug efflux system)